MLKYTFVVYHRVYADFLEQLRSVGVLHIDELPEGNTESDQLRDKLMLLDKINKTIFSARTYLDSKLPLADKSEYAADELLEALANFDSQISAVEQQINNLTNEIVKLRPWGDYDLTYVNQLKNAGYAVQFFEVPAEKYLQEWETEFNAVVVEQDKKHVRFLTLNHEEINIEQANLIQLNDLNANQLTQRIEDLNVEILNLKTQRSLWANKNLNNLLDLQHHVQRDADWDKALLNTESVSDEKVKILVGYCPVEQEAELNAMLDQKGIYYLTAEPTEEDNTPIKLRNNWFTKLFEPLTGMYGWPVYGEIDPTPILAPFFLLFFALCMGDAGYGFLLILFGYLTLKRKINIEMFEGLGPIIMVLGIGTIIVGFGLGTFFGIDLTQATWTPEWMKKCMIPSDATLAGYDLKMVLSMCIGIFHIALAMIIKAVIYTKRFGLKNNISTWAWLILILGSLIVGILLITNVFSVEAAQLALIIIGAVSAIGIYIFNTPGRNPLINIGSGLWDTYNMATGLVGDVLSYVRLYALGLAGGMLGNAFNYLGTLVLGENPNIFSWLGFIVILIFGHVLNLCMSALGAYVHPLRLTFVEFFKNSGYEGRGVQYKPFEN